MNDMYSIILVGLFFLFLALKLTGYIDWSWLWVLAPLWIPLAIVAVCGIGFLIILLFVNRKNETD
jgi:hypothetical protein